MNPDCKTGSHKACAGDAWDDTTDQLTECACECHERSREELIALASSWSGWCTDNDQTLPKLAELGGFLLEVKHRMAMDREGTP